MTSSQTGVAPRPFTVPDFAAAKGTRPITVLTAYDFPTAALFDAAGVDVLLVGDSLGMVVQGRAATTAVTLDQMVYHSEMVSRAAVRSFVVADLPFLTYHTGAADAVRNAGRLVQQGGATAVKLEGGRTRTAAIAAIVAADIPVMGHVGLTPQSAGKLGGFRVQRDADALLADALAVQDAGAFAVVVEAVPADLAARLTAELAIPTIGIGAGPHCDGQVLVWQDALGLNPGRLPKFVRRFADLAGAIDAGVRDFCRQVQAREYPDDQHSYR